MSRRHRYEPGFGSDSFLDVLANMVGILIIMIVVAGLRAGRGAAPAEATSSAAAPVPVEQAEAMLPVPAATEAADEPEIAELEPDRAPAEVEAELAQIDRDMHALSQRASETESDLARRARAAAAADAQLAEAEQAVELQTADLKKEKSRLARLQETLGEREQTLTGLLAEFEEVKNSQPPVDEVKHRLTPISQEAGGEEVHFRVLANRVSVVPFSQLEERVRFQLEKQKEWLARQGRHEGMVGPIDGYSLRYIVERQQLPAILERKLGYGGFRISVSRVEVLPEPDVVCETAHEALRRGSRFALALRSAGDKATLTFWVYPDSYKLFRQLQEAAHAEGFIVAARPLPEGMPIAGAPTGSRSAGQ